MNASTTSWSPSASISATARERSMRFSCVRTTPFGTPVVPEVKNIAAVSLALPFAIWESTKAGSRESNALPITSSRSEEHTSELQSRLHLVCRLLLEKKKKYKNRNTNYLLLRKQFQLSIQYYGSPLT